jgi:hypothetical protein
MNNQPKGPAIAAELRDTVLQAVHRAASIANNCHMCTGCNACPTADHGWRKDSAILEFRQVQAVQVYLVSAGFSSIKFHVVDVWLRSWKFT